MALWGGTYTKRINDRGDVFYSYDSLASPSAKTCKERTDDIDKNDPGNVGTGGGDAGLSAQLADINLGGAKTATREPQSRRRVEQDSNTTRTSLNTQWEIDNLPIHGAPKPASIEEPIKASGEIEPDVPIEAPGETEPEALDLSEEHAALIALETAYQALQLPIGDGDDGEGQRCMVHLTVQFIFRALTKINHIREDLEAHDHIYDERALAEEFYKDQRVALWGVGSGGDGDLDNQRLARLESFFAALRTQNATRSEVEGIGNEPLEQLVHLRRVAAAASRVISSDTDPVTSLAELNFALSPNRGHLVAQMLFRALSRVREDVRSFPCARPSDLLIEDVIERVLDRYDGKLWPSSGARPENVDSTLHQYILALMKTNVTSTEVASGMQMLDALLQVEGEDTEDEDDRAHAKPRKHAVFECTLVHRAEFESCLQKFVSTADVAAHLVDVHGWDQDTADLVVNDR